MAEKDRQIKELKGQRDAIFEEMHQSGASSRKDQTKVAGVMPHIHQSSIGSGFTATPQSGVKTMNKFQQSLLQGAAAMQKRTMDLRSPERQRQAFDRGDWASPVSRELNPQQQSVKELDGVHGLRNNPFHEESKNSVSVSQSIETGLAYG